MSRSSCSHLILTKHIYCLSISFHQLVQFVVRHCLKKKNGNQTFGRHQRGTATNKLMTNYRKWKIKTQRLNARSELRLGFCTSNQKKKKKKKRGYLWISVIPPCFIIVIIWSLECRLRGFFFSLTRLKYLEQTRVILSEQFLEQKEEKKIHIARNSSPFGCVKAKSYQIESQIGSLVPPLCVLQDPFCSLTQVCAFRLCVVVLFWRGRSGEYRGTTVGLMCSELITR